MPRIIRTPRPHPDKITVRRVIVVNLPAPSASSSTSSSSVDRPLKKTTLNQRILRVQKKRIRCSTSLIRGEDAEQNFSPRKSQIQPKISACSSRNARRSYTKEQKINIYHHYRRNGKRLRATARHFGIPIATAHGIVDAAPALILDKNMKRGARFFNHLLLKL